MKQIAKYTLCLMLVLVMGLAPLAVLAEDGAPASEPTPAVQQEQPAEKPHKEEKKEEPKAEQPKEEAKPEQPKEDKKEQPKADPTETPKADPTETPKADPAVTPEPAAEPTETIGDTPVPLSDGTSQPWVPGTQAEDEQAAEEQEQIVVSSYDMVQFVPNKDYGLFFVNSKNKAKELDGRTLTLDKSFVLRASFNVNAPVLAGVTYTYQLPAFLAGEKGADPFTFSHKGKAIATFSVKDAELRVEFTEYAQNRLAKGASYKLSYDFRETLDAREVKSATQFVVKMPMANGKQKQMTISIDGHPTSEPESTPEPEITEPEPEVVEPTEEPAAEQTTEPTEPEATVEPTVEPTEAPIPLCGLEEGDEHTHTDACYVEQPVEEIPEVPAVERTVTVDRVIADVMAEGDLFYLNATLVGFDDVSYTTRWQSNAGNGWKDVAGSEGTLTLQVTADMQNVNYDWRIIVSVDEPETDAAA